MGEIDNLPIENKPDIVPDKGKYGDIQNDGYMSKLKESIYDWRFWILGGFIIIGVGAIGYLYWDSICGCWKKGDDKPGERFVPANPAFEREIHGVHTDKNQTLPSTTSSTDSSNTDDSYSGLFRRSIVDRVGSYTNKIKIYFTCKKPPKLTLIPKGLYLENGKDMYNGMRLPRVEVLDNGTEYYLSKDTDGFIKAVNNTYAGAGTVDIINPFTNKIINRMPISISFRVAIINSARSTAVFQAPENSFTRNPIIENIGIDLSAPNIASTSNASSSSLPSLDDNSDIPQDPKVLPPISIREAVVSLKGKERDLSSPSGDKTPTQIDYSLDVENPFGD